MEATTRPRAGSFAVRPNCHWRRPAACCRDLPRRQRRRAPPASARRSSPVPAPAIPHRPGWNPSNISFRSRCSAMKLTIRSMSRARLMPSGFIAHVWQSDGTDAVLNRGDAIGQFARRLETLRVARERHIVCITHQRAERIERAGIAVARVARVFLPVLLELPQLIDQRSAIRLRCAVALRAVRRAVACVMLSTSKIHSRRTVRGR